MKKLLAVLGLLLALGSEAAAQSCGSSNPNCIVPDVTPATASNAQAANTKFVQQALAAFFATCPPFTSTLPGCVPASGGGTTNFLRADGTWNAPPGTVTAGGGGIVPTSGSPATLFIEQMNPGGRLTLASGVCAPASDSAAATTLYYAPCVSEWVPIYDGTNMELHQFTSGATDTVGLSIALGSNWTSSLLYDVFVGLNSGVVTLCTGPTWSVTGAGTSVRGSGAGTSQLALFKGLQTNAVSMTCRYSNTQTFTCAVNQCTYLGTVLISLTSNGQIDLKFGTAASGGGAACICIWNLYNQIQARPNVQDTTATFSPATGSWVMAMGGSENRIRFVTGIALQSYLINSAAFAATGNTAGDDFRIGCAINTTAPTNPDTILTISTVAAAVLTASQLASCFYAPVLGFNYVSSVYRSGGHTATFSGGIPNAQYLTGLLWF